MSSDRIVGINLGASNSLVAFMQWESPLVLPGEENFGMDRDIKLLEVEKGLDGGDLSEEDYVRASSIRANLAERIKNLKRQTLACNDGGPKAHLEESLSVDRARMAKIITILGRDVL